MSVFLLPAAVLAQQPAAETHEQAGATVPPAINTVSAPEDQLRLAEYFRELASVERELAESYSRIEAAWREKAPPPGLDPALSHKLKNQYKRLAEIEERAAAAASATAVYHSRLADLLGHPPVTVNPVRWSDSAFRR